VFDASALTTALTAYSRKFVGSTNLQLPDVLLSIVMVEQYSHGTGTYDEAAVGSGSGTTYFLSMNTQGSGQGSAGTLLKPLIEYKQYWGREVPTQVYVFFMQTPVTTAALLTKLTALAGATVNAWPKWVPQGHTLVMKGEKKNGEVRVKTGFQLSSATDGSSASDTGGKGKSFDVAPSIDSIHLPAMIHGSITVTGTTTASHALVVSASATDPVNGTIGDSISDTVDSAVTPTSFSATSPATVPTTGLYMMKPTMEPYELDFVRVFAEVVDFANVS
jgi:hypothetical protein